MTSRIAPFLAALVALTAGACTRCGDESAPAPVGSAAPPAPRKINMADQARLRPKDAGATVRREPDREAVAVARKLHEQVAKQCDTDQCRNQKCAPLCGQWLREKQSASDKPSFGVQRLYFDCLSYCMFPYPDGGPG